MKLKEHIYIYLEDNVFNKNIIEGLEKQLISFKNKDLYERLKKDKQKVEEYIKLYSLGITVSINKKSFITSLIFQDDGTCPQKKIGCIAIYQVKNIQSRWFEWRMKTTSIKVIEVPPKRN